MQNPINRQRKITSAAKAAAAVADRAAGILVIENDPDLQWALARMLTIRGNRVVGTSSGEGALALIEQWPVGLVLVDEELPGMDGIEVARRLGESHPHIPVVLLGNEEKLDASVAERLTGVVATLSKPFRGDALVELLGSINLAGRTSAPPPEPAE